MTDWYDRTSKPQTGAALSSSIIRAEFEIIETDLARLPNYTGLAESLCMVNAGGTGLESSKVLTSTATTGTSFIFKADTLTSGTALGITSNSSDVTARSLLFVHNDHASATSAVGVRIRQDSTAKAFIISDATTDNFTIDNTGLVIAASFVRSNPAPSIGDDLTNKTYVDGEITTLEAASVDLNGDTMTGLLTLSGAPIAALHAATKIYADLKLPKSGGTMTGLLVLSGAPTIDLHAATKVYVDNAVTGLTEYVAVTGDTMTGTLTLASIAFASTTQTTSTIMDIANADALTTGSVFNIVSNSSSASARTLGLIHNNHASSSSAKVLTLIQDSTSVALLINQNGNGNAQLITSLATTKTVFELFASTLTTGHVISCIGADDLTTGSMLRLESGSTSSSARDLVLIQNTDENASSTTCIAILQNANNPFMDFDGSTDSNTVAAISTLNTSGATTDHIQISLAGVKAWIAVSTNSPS